MVEKKTEEVIVAEYKLHIHCGECARAVEKHIIRNAGVQKVDINVESGKVIVRGTDFDVEKIQERIQRKTRKRVELISPKPKPKVIKPPEKKEDKKEVIKTTVLKVHLHCENCERDLKATLLKHKEIHKVETNRGAQTCTIVGTIKEAELIKYLHKKARKHGEVVPQKVEKKEETKKVKIEVKEGKEHIKVEVEENKEEVKSKDVVVPYFIHCTHAPQWFSDEDPNACSVM
ncbi:heavy metal-associated isoprenylated plant protein 3 [Canna indica]|uniref:Heavy metal-associated isoprenylated plant protein 3 n=1 Tax=Canna indica TaxID=4628 RepID=A0AAQ3KG74_9LILI|nr:heavy metal-associated isoprenylated plant protein 3 [Canna indica]